MLWIKLSEKGANMLESAKSIQAGLVKETTVANGTKTTTRVQTDKERIQNLERILRF